MEKKEFETDITELSKIEYQFWIKPENFNLTKKQWDELFFTYMRFLGIDFKEIEKIYEFYIYPEKFISNNELDVDLFQKTMKEFPIEFKGIILDVFERKTYDCFIAIIKKEWKKYFEWNFSCDIIDEETLKTLKEIDLIFTEMKKWKK